MRPRAFEPTIAGGAIRMRATRDDEQNIIKRCFML